MRYFAQCLFRIEKLGSAYPDPSSYICSRAFATFQRMVVNELAPRWIRPARSKPWEPAQELREI
jgi:hypothetical protein